MALVEDPIKNEQSYVELTCGTENVSPYSTGSGYSDQSTYYHTDYDWHHHQHHQQQHQQIYHQSEPQQQQQQQQHHQQQAPVQTIQYFAPNSYHDTQELTPVNAYPGLSHQAMHQSDFYNPVLWPSGQADYIPASTITTQTRLFSGIDVSQHVVSSPLQNGSPGQTVSNAKPKRKRVQSYSQRKAANVRERRRMFHLNEAFDVLRKRLPAFNYEKRLSRIETLRLAMTYISFMKDVSVGEDPKCIKLKPHGLDLDMNGQMPPLAHPDGSSLNSSSENCDLNAFSNDYSDSSSNDGLGMQGPLH